MAAGPDFSNLSHAQKDALIVSLMAQVAALTARLTELEAKLGLPAKTPDNSSVPPSKGQKKSEPSTPKAKANPHAGAHRPLHPNPTTERIVSAFACQGCGFDVSGVRQSPCESYDRIEIPEIKPDVTRVTLQGGVCPCCARRFKARPPEGLEPGSPPELVEGRGEPSRLRGLSARRPGHPAGPIERCVEGPVRPGHQRRRAGQHSERRPRTRRRADESDQGAPAGRHSVGVRRDRHAGRQYVIDEGDAVFAPGLKGLLKRACAIGRRRDGLADSTLKIYFGDLNRRLDRLLALKPTHKAGRKLQQTIKAIRGNIFVFVTNRDIEATNNGSERALRPCAVYRKITNGFRSEWGAKFYADIRSVVETARRRAVRAIDAIRITLRGQPLPRYA